MQQAVILAGTEVEMDEAPEERVSVWVSDDHVVVEIQYRFEGQATTSWVSNPCSPTEDRICIYERPWPFPSVLRRVELAKKQLEKRIAKRAAVKARLRGAIT